MKKLYTSIKQNRFEVLYMIHSIYIYIIYIKKTQSISIYKTPIYFYFSKPEKTKPSGYFTIQNILKD